jgi:hypothetical protein
MFDLERQRDQLGNALRKLNGKPRWVGEVGHRSIQEVRTKWLGLRPSKCGELRSGKTCVNDRAAIPRFAPAKPAKYGEKRWPKSSFW